MNPLRNRMVLLPEEIIVEIFRAVQTTDSVPDIYLGRATVTRPWEKPPDATYHPLANVTLVCKRWRIMSLPLFYRTVVIFRWRQIRALGRSLKTNVTLRPLTRHLHLRCNQGDLETVYHRKIGYWLDLGLPVGSGSHLARNLVHELLDVLQRVKRLEIIETYGLTARFWDAIMSHLGGPGEGSRRAIRRTLKIFTFFTGHIFFSHGLVTLGRYPAIFRNLQAIHINQCCTHRVHRLFGGYPEQGDGHFPALRVLSIGRLVGDEESNVDVHFINLLESFPELRSLKIATTYEEALAREGPLNEDDEIIRVHSSVPVFSSLMHMAAKKRTNSKMVDLDLGTGAGVFSEYRTPNDVENLTSSVQGRLSKDQRERMEESLDNEYFQNTKHLALGSGICPPPHRLPASLEHLHLRLPVVNDPANPDNQIPVRYPADVLLAKSSNKGLPNLKSITLEESPHWGKYPPAVYSSREQGSEPNPFDTIRQAASSAEGSVMLRGCLAWDAPERDKYLASMGAREKRRSEEYWHRWDEAVKRFTGNNATY